MFVAKLPGSMYATHAMNAGPRKGRRRNLLPSAEDASLARAGRRSVSRACHHGRFPAKV